MAQRTRVSHAEAARRRNEQARKNPAKHGSSRSTSSSKPQSPGLIIWNIVFWGCIATFVFCAIFFDFKFIRTGSMKPTLKVGAIVAINSHAEPEVGDIAMYTMGEGYVIHRIIDDNGKEYTFQGDNVGSPDMEPIAHNRVVGPVVMKFNFIAPIMTKIYHLDT